MYVKVGFLIKAFGSKGQMKFSADPFYMGDIHRARALFLKIEGDYIPFFIDRMEGEGDGLILFEDVCSKQDARPLSAKEIFLRKKDVKAVKVGEEHRSLESFLLRSETYPELESVIEEIIEYPEQLMAQIHYKEEENNPEIFHIFIEMKYQTNDTKYKW